MNNRILIAGILLVQVVCAAFFVSDIVITVLGLPIAPISWTFVELIEIGAALGLILGVIVGALALRQAWARSARAEEALRRARSAFRDMLEERFVEWSLTPAERDVALFAIKGFSTQDIADLRGVSEGTIKAQTNAIYRKAGVSGRPQLLSVFIDELVEEVPADHSSQASIRTSRGTMSSARRCVDARRTRGAAPSSAACRKREAQRHQRSPDLRPPNPYSGRGVDRSLPTYFE